MSNDALTVINNAMFEVPQSRLRELADAEAELAAFKARRCDGCQWYEAQGPLAGVCNAPLHHHPPMAVYFPNGDGVAVNLLVDADHACSAWTSR